MKGKIYIHIHIHMKGEIGGATFEFVNSEQFPVQTMVYICCTCQRTFACLHKVGGAYPNFQGNNKASSDLREVIGQVVEFSFQLCSKKKLKNILSLKWRHFQS